MNQARGRGAERRSHAAAAGRLAAELQIALGDQRIDIILVDPNSNPQPIHTAAQRTGVPL